LPEGKFSKKGTKRKYCLFSEFNARNNWAFPSVKRHISRLLGRVAAREGPIGVGTSEFVN
jgi:hypothetical protein